MKKIYLVIFLYLLHHSISAICNNEEPATEDPSPITPVQHTLTEDKEEEIITQIAQQINKIPIIFKITDFLKSISPFQPKYKELQQHHVDKILNENHEKRSISYATASSIAWKLEHIHNNHNAAKKVTTWKYKTYPL